MVALMIFGCLVYLLATEYISAKKPKGEVLTFRQGRLPNLRPKLDEEANTDDRVNTETLAREKTVPDAPASIQEHKVIFLWDSVNYDIDIKSKPRRLLDEVDGWVIPGSLTALMVRSFSPDTESGTRRLRFVFRVLPEPERPLYSMY